MLFREILIFKKTLDENPEGQETAIEACDMETGCVKGGKPWKRLAWECEPALTLTSLAK